jgi:hypothetical protein
MNVVELEKHNLMFNGVFFVFFVLIYLYIYLWPGALADELCMIFAIYRVNVSSFRVIYTNHYDDNHGILIMVERIVV